MKAAARWESRVERVRVKARHHRRQLRHFRERWQDAKREARLLSPDDPDAIASTLPRHIEAQVMKDYHRIEKALALRAPNRPFGVEPHARLSRDLNRLQVHSAEGGLVTAANDVLRAYDLWTSAGERLPIDEGGVVRELRADILAASKLDEPERFFWSRHSLRDFDVDEPPPLELLTRGVRLAQSAPSVCNRQAVAVNLYRQPGDIRRILELQRGSRGFRERIPALFVIHVDARLFTLSSERNQRWIDGGLFAMTLALALHSLGLGTCMLNWAVDNDLREQMRRTLGLPYHQDIVMLMAAGTPPMEVRAARSQRRALPTILAVDSPTWAGPTPAGWSTVSPSP